jgi:hypothetical protein
MHYGAVGRNRSGRDGIKRRKVLKSFGSTGAVGGAVISGTVAVPDSSEQPKVEELSGARLNRTESAARRTDAYRSYRNGLQQSAATEQFALSTDAASAYHVSESDGPVAEYSVISFPVEIIVRGPRREIDSNRGSMSAHLVIAASEKRSYGEVVVEKRTEEEPVVRTYRIRPEGKHGSLRVHEAVAEVDEEGGISVSSKGSESKVLESGIAPGVGESPASITASNDCLCVDVLSALCSTGCGVSAGVPCAIATGPAGVFACPVIVGALCAAYAIADACPPGSFTKRGACRNIGYC